MQQQFSAEQFSIRHQGRQATSHVLPASLHAS